MLKELGLKLTQSPKAHRNFIIATWNNSVKNYISQDDFLIYSKLAERLWDLSVSLIDPDEPSVCHGWFNCNFIDGSSFASTLVLNYFYLPPVYQDKDLELKKECLEGLIKLCHPSQIISCLPKKMKIPELSLPIKQSQYGIILSFL